MQVNGGDPASGQVPFHRSADSQDSEPESHGMRPLERHVARQDVGLFGSLSQPVIERIAKMPGVTALDRARFSQGDRRLHGATAELRLSDQLAHQALQPLEDAQAAARLITLIQRACTEIRPAQRAEVLFHIPVSIAAHLPDASHDALQVFDALRVALSTLKDNRDRYRASRVFSAVMSSGPMRDALSPEGSLAGQKPAFKALFDRFSEDNQIFLQVGIDDLPKRYGDKTAMGRYRGNPLDMIPFLQSHQAFKSAVRSLDARALYLIENGMDRDAAWQALRLDVAGGVGIDRVILFRELAIALRDLSDETSREGAMRELIAEISFMPPETHPELIRSCGSQIERFDSHLFRGWILDTLMHVTNRLPLSLRAPALEAVIESLPDTPMENARAIFDYSVDTVKNFPPGAQSCLYAALASAFSLMEPNARLERAFDQILQAVTALQPSLQVFPISELILSIQHLQDVDEVRYPRLTAALDLVDTLPAGELSGLFVRGAMSAIANLNDIALRTAAFRDLVALISRFPVAEQLSHLQHLVADLDEVFEDDSVLMTDAMHALFRASARLPVAQHVQMIGTLMEALSSRRDSYGENEIGRIIQASKALPGAAREEALDSIMFNLLEECGRSLVRSDPDQPVAELPDELPMMLDLAKLLPDAHHLRMLEGLYETYAGVPVIRASPILILIRSAIRINATRLPGAMQRSLNQTLR